MICPNCKKELSDQSKFCGYCGVSIRQRGYCTVCGAALTAGSLFCPACGSKAHPLVLQEEIADQTEQLRREEENINAQLAAETKGAEADATRQEDCRRWEEELDASMQAQHARLEELDRCEQALEERSVALSQAQRQLADQTAALNERIAAISSVLPDVPAPLEAPQEMPPVPEAAPQESVSRAEKPEKKPTKPVGKLVLRIAIAAVAAVAVVFAALALIRAGRYRAALSDMENGAYLDAISALEALGDYKDCPDQLLAAWVGRGDQLRAEQDYDGAIAAYTAAQEAPGALDGIHRTHYEHGKALLASGDLRAAVQELNQADDVEDAQSLLRANSYTVGVQLLEQENFADAAEYLDMAEDTQDAKKLYAYAKGRALMDSGEYIEAVKIFRAAGNYADSSARIQEACYRAAGAAMRIGDYEKAQKYYVSAGDYEDAAALANEAAFRAADELARDGSYDKAIQMYQTLPGSYSFEGATAAGQIAMLQQAQKASGTKKATKNYIETKQVYTRTGTWDSWYRDSLQSGQYIELETVVNSDHTFDIKGSVHFMHWTDYSYVQEYLEDPVYSTRSFRIKNVTSIPSTYEIDDDLTLYYSNGTFSIKYYKSEHYSSGKDYRYTSNVTF